MYVYPKLETALNSLLGNQRCHIIIDMAGLDYFGSAGLSALIYFPGTAEEQQGSLKLVAPPPRIKSIIDLLGYCKIFKVYDDETAALNAFVDEMKSQIITA